MTKKIGFIVGSLREGSYNKLVAKKFAELLPEGFEAVFLEIGNLPFYNEDLEVEGKVPTEWTTFRNELQSVDCVFFFTPYILFLTSSIEKCLGCRFTSLWSKQLERETCFSRKCFTRCDRWFWCEPSPASIIGILRYANFATTRSLYRWNHELDR